MPNHEPSKTTSAKTTVSKPLDRDPVFKPQVDVYLGLLLILAVNGLPNNRVLFATSSPGMNLRSNRKPTLGQQLN